MEALFYILAIIIIAFVLVYSFIYINNYKNIRWFSTPSPEGKYADSNGKKIFYRIKGKGGAVVVVMNSLGSSQAEWWPIQNEVGNKCRIITYDSPGYDWSTSEDEAKTINSVSDELKLILKFEKIRKPVYIVAYGTGAFKAKQYVKDNPDKVSGILFINPMPFRYSEWLEAINNIDECPDLIQAAKKKRKLASKGIYRLSSPFKGYKLDKRYKKHIIEHYSRTANYATLINDLEQLENNLNEVNTTEDFPDIPIHVLYPASESLIRDWVRSGINEYSARQLQRVYEDLSKDITKLSSNTVSREVMNSGEFIHLSKPDIIVNEIIQMVSDKKKDKKKSSTKE